MNCKYCNKPCEQLSRGPVHFKCIGCMAQFYFKKLSQDQDNLTHTSTQLTRIIGDKTYHAYLLYYCNKTIIDCNYQPEFTFGGSEPDIQETILTVDDILPISPENFLNKLKTYILFS